MATPEEKVDIVELTRTYLTDDRPEELIPLLKCPKRKDQMIAVAWDLVPVLCEFLTYKLEHSRRCVVSGAGEILLYLATVGNPKELLLVLLEQADTFKDDVKFRMLLAPVQQCLLRLPSKKSYSLAVALETLNAHIESLPTPEERQFEGRERLLLDFDECVQRATEVVPAYLNFLGPFVEEVAWGKHDPDHRQKHHRQVYEITRCVVKMLSHPLAHLDLAHEPDQEHMAKSASRSCAEKAMGLLGKLQPNFVGVLLKMLEENEAIGRREIKVKATEKDTEQVDELERYDLQEPLPDLGLCVFAYLAFGEKMCPECLPQTYSHTYLLELSLPFIGQLLERPESLAVGKGLSLLASLLTKIPVLSQPASNMENENITRTIKGLIGVMTSAKVQELCHTAVKLLEGLMGIFEHEGRSKYFQYVMNITDHEGVLGYMANVLKNELDEALKVDPPPKCFTGVALEKLLKLVFVLPQEEKTDLLENNDRIMGALNLLRYLILRDPPSTNVTGIWDQLPDIEKNYCENLREGLRLSRAHYQREVKRLKECKGKKEPDISVTVGGESMAGMDTAQQLQVLELALHSFDMMESVLVRVGELIEQQRKPTNKDP